MPETPLLDSRSLSELHSIMGDSLDVLLEEFERQSADTLLQLRAALDESSVARTTTFKRVAHKFKGAALNLYCCKIADCCAELEQVTSHLSTDEYRMLVKQLESSVLTTRHAIIEWKSDR